MNTFGGSLRSVLEELPEAPLVRWASAFFSVSILTLLISLAAAQAFLALASVVYAVHLLRPRYTRTAETRIHHLSFPPLKLPLALFCLFSVVSVFRAANPAVGGFAVRKLVLFLIWALAVNLIVSARHLEILYRGLFLESALAGLVAAWQFIVQYRAVRALHPARIYFYMTVERVHGFMGHWMNFGGQQMLVFAALLSFLLLSRVEPPGLEPARPKPFKKILGWPVLLIVVASIVLNFSRGVWLGCAVATLYLASRWKPRWLWALPLLWLAAFLAAPALIRQRVRVLRHPARDPSLAIRFEMWQVGLRMIRTHPFVGVGPNSIEQVYPLYLPGGEMPIVGYHQHLHNNFLQLGAERGLPCLASWVWLIVALLWHLGRMRRQHIRERRPAWITEAAIAAWLAFVVEGCFEFNFGTSPVLMLFLFVTATPFIVEGGGPP